MYVKNSHIKCNIRQLDANRLRYRMYGMRKIVSVPNLCVLGISETSLDNTFSDIELQTRTFVCFGVIERAKQVGESAFTSTTVCLCCCDRWLIQILNCSGSILSLQKTWIYILAAYIVPWKLKSSFGLTLTRSWNAWKENIFSHWWYECRHLQQS